MTTWKDRFEAFFSEQGPIVPRLLGTRSEPPLGAILDAYGCRELWVQGEAFRYFRETGMEFHTNAIQIGHRQTADFASATPDHHLFTQDGELIINNLGMIPELKV